MDRVVHLISLDMYIIPGKTTSGLDNNTDLNQLHWFKEKQTVTVKVLTFFFSYEKYNSSKYNHIRSSWLTD